MLLCGRIFLGARFRLVSSPQTWERTDCAHEVHTSVNSTLSVHTFFSCAFCQRACPSLLSQLSRWIQPQSHALTPRTRVARDSRSTLFVSCPKTVTPRRAMSHVTSHLRTPSTGTPSSHVPHPPVSEPKPCADPILHNF